MDLKNISTTHEQILNWLLLNPHKSMRECADTFGYTQSWLSTLVRSDLFQAALAEKQKELSSRVASNVTNKLTGVVDVALDKLAEHVEKSENPDFLLAVADKGLHRLGFGPASYRNPNPSGMQGPLVQQNFMVSAADLVAARQMASLSGPATQLPPLSISKDDYVPLVAVTDGGGASTTASPDA